MQYKNLTRRAKPKDAKHLRKPKTKRERARLLSIWLLTLITLKVQLVSHAHNRHFDL